MERKSKLTPKEISIFAMLGALMFCGKLIMEAAPNIHPLGMLIMSYTVVYRKKAIIPIMIYLILQGVYAGFNMWWIPYLYIWPILWGITLLLPKNMPTKTSIFVYPAVCAIHGFLFGTLYAPAQAIMFGLSFKGMLAWIAAGLPFDIIQGVGNACAGILVLPMSKLLQKLENRSYS